MYFETYFGTKNLCDLVYLDQAVNNAKIRNENTIFVPKFCGSGVNNQLQVSRLLRNGRSEKRFDDEECSKKHIRRLEKMTQV